MFSIEKCNEIIPCLRGKELLTSILETTGISKLWLSADHVFVARNGSSDLYAFDVVPQLRWRNRRTVQTKQNDCLLETNEEPTVEVVWNTTEPSFIYVVSKTGTTSFWEFLKPSHEWIKHKSFQLSNAKGARIIDVRLHEASGNIVWCERRGSGVETYCVCCRGIIRDVNEKAKAELGTTQAILHNCPPVNICSFRGGVCIHPCQVFLEKIYIFWTGLKDVKAVVFKDGKVEESTVGSSDFRDIATALVGCWSENPDELSSSCLGITTHPSNGDLLILNCKGILSKLCIKSKLVKLIPVCNLELPSDRTEEVRIFTNGLIFGLIDGSGVIFLYDILSGKLLQMLDNFTGSTEELNVLKSYSCLPTTVFLNLSGFWKLVCPSLNELVRTVNTAESVCNEGEVTGERTSENALKVISINEDSFNEKVQESLSEKPCDQTAQNSRVLGVVDIAMWLCAYGLDHSASVLMLDHVISCLGERMEIPRTPLDILRKLGKKVLQSPTVLLALCDNDLSLRENDLGELKLFLEELDQGSVPSVYITPLNMQILPFLRELFSIWTQQREVPSVDLSKLSNIYGEGETIDIDAAIQSVVSGIPDGVCLDKLEIQSLQEPEHTVEAFVPVNGESGKIHGILRIELKDRRWKRKRSPENAIVLGSLFQLLYNDHPEMLVDILEVAKESIAEGASEDEATLQDLQECVRDFTLEFLPSVWSKKECDIKRINIHANLLVRLGLQRDAIELFLQRKQWQEAVDLYIELSHYSTDPVFTSQLYEMLLTGLLRGSGTSQRQLLMKVFELKPEIIEVCNFFELCLMHIPSNYAEAVLDETSLTVGQAREALGQFLPKF